MDKILQEAIRVAGGPTKLAKHLVNPKTGEPLTRQAIGRWRRVPPEYCLQVEDVTGISRHVLRPDIYGPLALSREAYAAA